MAFLVMGVVAMESFSSDMARFFTRSPTDKSVWMFIAGVLTMIAGGVGATCWSRPAKS